MLATDIRARSFSDIVGQDTIVKSLRNYFKNDNLPDVIFFIGHSGSGKTNLAYITAMTLNCSNPTIDENGNKNPCGVCPSCLDVKNERFQRDIHVYNGGQLKADGIEEIEEQLNYTAMSDKNLVFVLNEAQMITSIKKFLAIIEKPRKNTYFILTSTDKDKFKNVVGSSNKDQETNALRSRGAYFNIKPIATATIKDFLFSLLEKIDPEATIPDTFIEEGLQLISENSNGNMRMAINDFSQCISAEAYTLEEARSLLGYDDEKEFVTILFNLAVGNKEIISVIQKQDLSSFFQYTWKVLSDIALRDIIDQPFNEQWKEKSARAIIDSGNVSKLLSMYEEVNRLSPGYFNEKVLMNALYRYFKSLSTTTEAVEAPIKKKKIVKVAS